MDKKTQEFKLIVDQFKRISDPQDCTPDHHADLPGTYWKLLELGGKVSSQCRINGKLIWFYKAKPTVLKDMAAAIAFSAATNLNGTDSALSGSGTCPTTRARVYLS